MTRQEIHSGTKQAFDASWEIIFPQISKEIGHTFRFNRSTMDVFLMHSECNHKKPPSVILFVLGNVVSPIWEWFIRSEKDTLMYIFPVLFDQKVVNLFYIGLWTEKLNWDTFLRC